jgi:uncharacterized membrane protein
VPPVPPLVVGALFVVVGLPLVASWIPPNRLYGFRTRATLADPATWYRVNRATGLDLVAGGLVLMASGYALPPQSPVPTALLLLVVALMVAHGA